MELATENDLIKFYEYSNAQDHVKLKKASEFTFDVLHTICEFVRPGVKESEVINHCYEVYKKYDVDRIWHKPFIRFGKHTITTFRDHPSEDLVLQEEDIAYVDIGIVKDGIEGDAGKTLCFGGNPIYSEIVELTERLYQLGREFWKSHNATGYELYEYIETQANERGYEINLKPAGHIIGSFPHANANFKNGMSNFPEPLHAYAWILEVQIRHPELDVGGFYEQLLF